MIRQNRFSGRQFHRHALAAVIAVTVAFALYTFWRQKEAAEALTRARDLMETHLEAAQLAPDWRVERVETEQSWIGVAFGREPADGQQQEPLTAAQASALAAVVCPPRGDPIWVHLEENQDIILWLPVVEEAQRATVSCRLFLANTDGSA